ncbi:hypothetical protein R3I93_006787 [Phoxinus phoxinus]|uniref:Somatostatin/Cortistatin C-terminal domain-containing protein n=1 Tax=Phoxinus phoxinus TaxID=58324 RepID=A0AAN9D735_9TELE
MLPIALVLLFFSLLLPCGGASVKPVRVFSSRATETSADTQTGLSEGFIPRLLILLSNTKDAEQDNSKPFRGTLLDGDAGPMKRQEEHEAEPPAEVFTVKQTKRKEGCRFLYYKTWTAC